MFSIVLVSNRDNTVIIDYCILCAIIIQGHVILIICDHARENLTYSNIDFDIYALTARTAIFFFFFFFRS